MVTVAIGALAGWAFSSALIGLGLVTTAFGAIALGASLGSLFVSRDVGDYSSSPNYSFGPISNTMSQLVPIFVVYGKNRVAGNIIYQVFDSDKKEVQDLYVLVGEGGMTSISDVMANDQNPAELDGCSVTTYLDTDSTTHDSRDPSDARPYPDNVALICLTLKAQENLNGTPTITSIVEGMKVWTPGGFAYSRNPIWIILDILCHPRYGMGMGVVDSSGAYLHPNWDKIDYACALAAANYCDATVEYGPRFQLDFVIDTQRPIRDILTDFLAVCRGYMVQTDKLEIYIDAPVSTYSRSITPGNIVEGSFTFWQAADTDICNRITIDWIDPENSYERVTDVFQDSDDISVRGVVEKSVSLLGITCSGQVGHMGYYLLKSSLLVRNFCSFGVSFKDCDIQPGEVLTVSFEDFTGWKNKPFRVISVKDNGNDVMTVTCSEYIPEIYDDSVMEVPVHIDTSLTTNYKPDDVEDLAITEQLETLQDGSYNLIAKITWTPPESYQTLELWYRYSSEVAWVAGGTLPKGSMEYYLPCTGNIGDTLYVRVYTVSRLGVRSSGQTTSRILRGDLTPPAAPTNLQGEGGFRLAHITWTDPPDGDLDHIDVYRSFTADDAEDFTKIGIAPRFAQEYIDNGLGVLQTAWYKLKAVDVAGNESVFSEVVSATTKVLDMGDIPEASIDESKLLPGLAQKIDSIDEINAAIPPIVAEIDNIGTVTIPAILGRLENVGMAAIPALLNALSLDQTMEQGAAAERTLSTKVDEGLAAEATERLKLAARVDDTMAAVTEETTARVEGDNALSERITTIGAQIDETAAVIEEETTARVEGDAALSQQIATVSAKADENAAVIQEETTARAEGDAALTERITTLSAQTSDSISAIQQSMTADTGNGVSVVLAAVSQDKTLESQAIAERTLTVKFNEEVTERLLLAIKQSDTQAALEVVNQIVQGPNGLVAQHYIKTDVNGNVAGVGLYNDGNVSEFAILANRFFIAKADGSITPVFEINSETGLAQLIGDLIASGSFTGREFNAAAQINLGAGGALVAGADAIVQIGTAGDGAAMLLDSSTGRIVIRDPNNLTTGNYVDITTGDITTYQYIAGAYRAMKSLRKMEVGVGENGTTITLPGYWPSQPKIQVSPNALQCYDASYPNQSQQLRCYAENITYNNGIVTFMPKALLEIKTGTKLVNLPARPEEGHPVNNGITLQTGAFTLPAGVSNVIVTAKVYAQDIYSTSGWTIYMRDCSITVNAVIGGVSYTVGTITIQAAINSNIRDEEPVDYYKTISKSISVSVGSSGAQIYLTGTAKGTGNPVPMGGEGIIIVDGEAFWLRFDSLQYDVAASSKLAEGTLNYVAIAE